MQTSANPSRRPSRLMSLCTRPCAMAVAAMLGAAFSPAYAMPPDLDLEFVATLDSQVVDIANTGVGGDDRIFAVRKVGVIHIVDGGSLLGTPFFGHRCGRGRSGVEQ